MTITITGTAPAPDHAGDTSMKKRDDTTPLAPASFGRRSFLFSAAGGGVAGVAAVTGLGTGQSAPPEAQAETGPGRGLSPTAHIQRYYRSTRLCGEAAMLTRKSSRSPAAAGNGLSEALAGYVAPKRLDRRSFLKRSGIAAGAGAIGANLPFAMVRPAEAATAAAGDGAIEVRRSVAPTARWAAPSTPR